MPATAASSIAATSASLPAPALLRGGMDGSVVVPGNAAQSLLLRLIRHQGPADDPMPMPPPPRHKLSDADIATIAQWIQAGMAMPPDPPKQ